jgi:hypothetical protein
LTGVVVDGVVVGQNQNKRFYLSPNYRKLIDRKLTELRSALEGDTVLREALMERNEALQVEINRLRKAKLMSLSMNSSCMDGECSNPPSEMSAIETLSSLNTLPPSTTAEKQGPKKNRYTAAYAGHKRDPMPRTVVSSTRSIPSSST